ncbi:hypothetical protein ACWEKT_03090 [Nocardia takedensis]
MLDVMKVHDDLAALLTTVRSRLPPTVADIVETDLSVGELGSAVEAMVDFLYKRRIPLSHSKFERIRAVLSVGFGPPVPRDDFLRCRDAVLDGLVVTHGLLTGPPLQVVGRSLPYFDVLGPLAEEDPRELASVGKSEHSRSKGAFEWLLLNWATAILVLERETNGDPPVWNAYGVDRFAHTMGLRGGIDEMLPLLRLATGADRALGGCFRCAFGLVHRGAVRGVGGVESGEGVGFRWTVVGADADARSGRRGVRGVREGTCTSRRSGGRPRVRTRGGDGPWPDHRLAPGRHVARTDGSSAVGDRRRGSR